MPDDGPIISCQRSLFSDDDGNITYENAAIATSAEAYHHSESYWYDESQRSCPRNIHQYCRRGKQVAYYGSIGLRFSAALHEKPAVRQPVVMAILALWNVWWCQKCLGRDRCHFRQTSTLSFSTSTSFRSRASGSISLLTSVMPISLASALRLLSFRSKQYFERLVSLTWRRPS